VGVNNEQEQEPGGGRGEGPQRERSGDGITPQGRSHQGGGERGGGVDDEFSGVEISIARGVEETVLV